MAPNEELFAHAQHVRHFTRFYTRKFAVLDEHLLDGPFTLIEARVVFEIANHDRPTAALIATELGLDTSYLSRTLKGLEKRGFLTRAISPDDARQSLLSLTKQGRDEFTAISKSSQEHVVEMLQEIQPAEQRRLINAMSEVERILGNTESSAEPYLLRPHQPGDIGWVIQTHGLLYAEEYGWDETFEALVAEVAAKFIRNFDAKFERCWIAELNGQRVGSAFVVRESGDIARLRLLIVDPQARGLGIGQRLVAECIRFARQKRYKTLTLWTNDILVAARHIYQSVGFELADEELHHSFGHDLVGQNWNLKL
mgnify:CR=1 FL=1